MIRRLGLDGSFIKTSRGRSDGNDRGEECKRGHGLAGGVSPENLTEWWTEGKSREEQSRWVIILRWKASVRCGEHCI